MSPQENRSVLGWRSHRGQTEKGPSNPSESTIVVEKITHAAICQIREELDQLEVHAKLELEDPRTSAVGVLRTDLIEECRRRLLFITAALFEERRDP